LTELFFRHVCVIEPKNAEALKAMGEYVLLLSDIPVPGIDVISLACCVARDHPELAIRFPTGYASEVKRATDLDRALAAGLASTRVVRRFALQLRAVHDTALAIVECFAAVHDTTIVPKHEITLFPTVGIYEPVLHGVAPYFVE
jgi:hypothetical protein